jgi:N-acyl-D-aspartate/D-glutamate deacylase
LAVSEFDLVIRNGTIVDGSGNARFSGDVAVRQGRIAAIGSFAGSGAEEIDATDRIVTPGFVDIHTHYDGHATWTNKLEPSSQHGVTTVVTGNCGVGFAPCREADRAGLVRLMEGVEDIPEPVMAAGLPWNWQSFPEYLDVLESRAFDLDVATQIPHAPLRVFVMGERALGREPATPTDIAAMQTIVREAVGAGALGFSTSRSLNHKASDGTITPSYAAASDELAGIARGLTPDGTGVLQFISDFDDIDGEFAIVRRMARESGRPLSLSLLQFANVPDRWREVLDRVEQARGEGEDIRVQVCGRPVGVMMGLDFSRNPFLLCEGYREVAQLDPAARQVAMIDPTRRSRILAEFDATMDAETFGMSRNFSMLYELGEMPDYEPAADQCIAARATAAGIRPVELLYDILLEPDGVIYIPAANYAGNSMAAIRQMLAHPASVLGLGDGGAHCGLLCDASLTTHMLARWARRGTGKGGGEGMMSLERVVHALTARTATTVGLRDRGHIAPGMRADFNVIDIDNIGLFRPEAIADLPGGAKRIGQRAKGYDATIVAGTVTRRAGEHTGALPGRLVRGGHSRLH